MKSIISPLTQLLNSLRIVAIAGVCALMLFANAAPAFAFGSTPSPRSEGTVQMDKIQQESEDAIKGMPRSEDTIRKANEGINGVQGSADASQMHQGDANPATSIKDDIADALEDITGK